MIDVSLSTTVAVAALMFFLTHGVCRVSSFSQPLQRQQQRAIRSPQSTRRFVAVTRSRSATPTRLLFAANKRNNHEESKADTTIATTTTSKTLATGSHLSEMVVKKSRFLAYAQHAASWDEAQDYIRTIHELHPKGRHWCYGFQCGMNPVSERCSDDGEPTGTAGVPILGAIKGEELSDVVCVVVRYFGGIKLGAGGLIRAYGGAARQVLREAPVEVLIPKSTIRINVESSFVGTVYDCVAKVSGGSGCQDVVSYNDDGTVTMTIVCDLEVSSTLRERLRDATRGSVEFLEDDDDDENGG